MPRFPGAFNELPYRDDLPFSSLLEPSIGLEVGFVGGGFPFEGRRGEVEFLIDTGSQRTVLHPRDSQRLLGDDLFAIDWANDPALTAITGVGGGTLAVEREAEFWMTQEEGESAAFDLNLQIMRPEPFRPALAGNWLLPSLLGRDILHYLDLWLSYNPPTVYLATPAGATGA